MKKLLVSILAVAALAACTKSDVIYDEPSEITVSPVSGNITKAMMTGVTFATSQDFNVWAWYKQVEAGTSIAGWQGAKQTQQDYIIESPFENRDKSNSWGGVTPYYWPKQGSLLFAGYYPTSIANQVEYNFDATTNEMVFTGITPTQVLTSTNDFSEDIMYFNMTEKSAASGPVAVTFKHALSWITFNVAKTTDSPKIVIDEIAFTEVYESGNGTVNGSDVIVWECITSDQYNNEVKPVKKNVTITDNEKVLTTKSTKLEYEPLFIPQVMKGDLYIKYTVIAKEATADDDKTEKFTEVYKVSLSGKDSSGKPYAWDPAKHYIFNIVIGTTEILINPEVEDWTEVEVNLPHSNQIN